MARFRQAFFHAIVRRPGHEATSIPVWPLPFAFGRSASDSHRSEVPGLFDRHVIIELAGEEGFVAQVREGAVATIDGQPFRRHRLRNGDRLQLGGLSVQFFVAPAPRNSLRVREWFFWISVFSVVILEGLILALLLREG